MELLANTFMKLPQTLPPRFYTEQFWKELAEEWRGEETNLTNSGICFQAAEKLRGEKDYYWKVCHFMEQYAPEHIKDKNDYFWPPTDKSRLLRAELCERIAKDMKQLYGNTNTNLENTRILA